MIGKKKLLLIEPLPKTVKAYKLEEVSCTLHQENDYSCILPSHYVMGRGIRTRSLSQNSFFLEGTPKAYGTFIHYLSHNRNFNNYLNLSFNIYKKFLKHRKHDKFRPEKKSK